MIGLYALKKRSLYDTPIPFYSTLNGAVFSAKFISVRLLFIFVQRYRKRQEILIAHVLRIPNMCICWCLLHELLPI